MTLADGIAFGTVLITAIGMFASWLRESRRQSDDHSRTVIQGFDQLLEDLQRERDDLRNELFLLRHEVAALRRLVVEHNLPLPSDLRRGES